MLKSVHYPLLLFSNHMLVSEWKTVTVTAIIHGLQPCTISASQYCFALCCCGMESERYPYLEGPH